MKLSDLGYFKKSDVAFLLGSGPSIETYLGQIAAADQASVADLISISDSWKFYENAPCHGIRVAMDVGLQSGPPPALFVTCEGDAVKTDPTPASFHPWVGYGTQLLVVDHVPDYGRPLFSHDLSSGTNGICSGNLALELVAYMGYDRIFGFGFDVLHANGSLAHLYDFNKTIAPHDAARWRDVMLRGIEELETRGFYVEIKR